MTGGSVGEDPTGSPFPRHILARDTLAAARALIGAWLVRDPLPADGTRRASAVRRVGRVVEVEAYLGEDDRASHARMGLTSRNQVMFGPPGIAYVYLVYGMHHCLNVVTEPAPRAAAVLIRAVEPVAGVDAMRAAREHRSGRRLTVPDPRLTAGPGRLAGAFDVDRRDTGTDLCNPASSLRLELPTPRSHRPVITATARIGVAHAGEPWASRPWRFVLVGSPSLSGPAATRPHRIVAGAR